MTAVVAATDADVAEVVELEARLFAEDAGVHERHANVGWPGEHGDRDARELLADPDGLILLARVDAEAVGLLMGYASTSGPTRRPIRSATLRTLYVAEHARGSGVGSDLVTAFLQWARDRGCVEAQVDHYVANDRAGELYGRFGFEPHSLNRVLHLD